MTKWYIADEERDDAGNIVALTERLSVPGGWIYRLRVWPFIAGQAPPESDTVVYALGFVPEAAD